MQPLLVRPPLLWSALFILIAFAAVSLVMLAFLRRSKSPIGDARRDGCSPRPKSAPASTTGIDVLLIASMKDADAHTAKPEDDSEDTHASAQPVPLVRTTAPLPPWFAGPVSLSTETFAEPGENDFMVRGPSYLRDRLKTASEQPVMRLAACDWISSSERLDHISSLLSGVAQKAILPALKLAGLAGGPIAPLFVVNLQVPIYKGNRYSLVLYFVMRQDEPLGSDGLIARFLSTIKDDEADNMKLRKQRFKLIPSIRVGPWILQRAVGSKPALLGHALTLRLFSGESYVEIDIDAGSSSIASSTVSLALGYARGLVVDLAFLAEAVSEEELPERLLGAVRISHLDPASAVSVDALVPLPMPAISPPEPICAAPEPIVTPETVVAPETIDQTGGSGRGSAASVVAAVHDAAEGLLNKPPSVNELERVLAAADLASTPAQAAGPKRKKGWIRAVNRFRGLFRWASPQNK